MIVSRRTLDEIATRILHLPTRNGRRLIAIAGAPASGKSTLAVELSHLMETRGMANVVVPLDGYHLDNRILIDRGTLARKGAPETFDASGFLELVGRARTGREVVFPIFDRDRDISVAGAGIIGPDCEFVLFEGNYLLLDADPWRKLASEWDLSVFLDVPPEELRKRLIQRWLDHGLTRTEAIARSEGNDLVNADLVVQNSRNKGLRIQRADGGSEE